MAEFTDISLKIENFITTLAPDVWGVADLTTNRSWLRQEYGDFWEDYPRAISLGVFFPRQVVNDLLDGPTHTYLRYYDVLNSRLDDMACRLANFLERYGAKSFPVPASQRMGEDKLASLFSHRFAARLAGLGWIGKNSCLIHPEVGPRLRFATVLTNASLSTGTPLESHCPDGCHACRDICPAGAIQGVPFRIGQPLSYRLDAAACAAWLAETRHSFGKQICGRCVAVCPTGRFTPPVV